MGEEPVRFNSLFVPFLACLFITGCPAAPSPYHRPDHPRKVRFPQDEEVLRKRIRELTEDLERTRAELAASQRELFTLKLRLVEASPDEYARVLREEGLEAPHEVVRLLALQTLSSLPPVRQKEFHQDLVSTARQDALPLRLKALQILGRWPEGEPTLIEAATDDVMDVRRAAATAMRSGSASTLAALTTLASDGHPEVRLAALESLYVTRNESALAPILRAATEDTDPHVVDKAIDLLGNLAVPSTAPILVRLLEETSSASIRWSTINALGKIGVPDSAAAIRPYLHREHPPNLREIAAQALGKLHDSASIPALATAFQEDTEIRVREAAAGALGTIGGSEVLRSILLPAALDNRDPPLQRAAWQACLVAAGHGFEDLHLLASSMLERGRRSEVEDVCQRLHNLRFDGAQRDRAIALEEKIVTATLAAGEWRATLGHLRRILADQPTRFDLSRKVAQCHRELGEFEASLSTLTGTLSHVEQGSPMWWELKLELVLTLEAATLYTRVIEEATLEGSIPDAARETLASACSRATSAVISSLSSADPALRKRTLEAVKPLGRKIIPALADAIRNTTIADRTDILAAGNAIVGTTHSDLSKSDDIARDWLAWLQK